MTLFISVFQILVLCFGFLAAKHDLRTFLIPNRLNLNIFLLSLSTLVIRFDSKVFLVCLTIFLLHLLPALLIPNSIGMGDVKFIGALSLMFNSVEQVVIWIGLSYGFGLIHGFWLKISKNSSRIPFGVSIYGAFTLVSVGEYLCVAMDYCR